jgi:putative PIN family toxin of toxin-antitoxin system
MKVILDTNVFVSGVFFSGPPFEILSAWRKGQVQLVISPEILEEYYRVGERLSERFPGIDLEPILALLTVKAQLIPSPALPESVCDDPDDDKFLACAIASGTKVVVSGDRHLLKASGYSGITVIRPRKFVEEFLEGGAES